MRTRLRVLHLITWLNRGGIEIWLLELAEEAGRLGVEMDFACKGASEGALASRARALGCQVYRIPLGLEHARFVAGLRSLLRTNAYDVVHCHLDAYSGIAVGTACLCGVPCVTSFHNTGSPPQTWTRMAVLRNLRMMYAGVSVNYALKHSDVITGCSQAVLDRLRQSHPAPAGNWRVLRYGLREMEPSTQARSALRAAWGICDKAPILVHVGRFLEQKNHVGLLRIFRSIRSQIPAARLVLVGDGPLRMSIETMARELGLGDAVIFAGLRDDVHDILCASDLFVFPSLFEGLGLVLVEAARAGLPIVASAIPGISEAVVDGVTAELRPVGEEERFAEAALQLLTDPARHARMGAASRQWFGDQWTIRRSTSAALAVYEEAMGQASAR